MATACFCGLPEAISALTFEENDLRLVPFFSGMAYGRFKALSLLEVGRYCRWHDQQPLRGILPFMGILAGGAFFFAMFALRRWPEAVGMLLRFPAGDVKYLSLSRELDTLQAPEARIVAQQRNVTVTASVTA